MPTQPTISQWVKAARAGEQPAWENLYRTYYPSVYAMALNICKTIPLAQDMVQETFTTAFTKLSQLKEPDALGGWLKRILVHHCYRALQKEKHVRKQEISHWSEAWWENDWDQKLESLSNKHQIYASLAPLSETLRSVLLLRYFSDYSAYEDISNILGIPIGTVRSRLNEARKMLSKSWSQRTEEDPNPWQRAEEWNHFYRQSFESMHQRDDYKNRFLGHLEKNVLLTMPDGRSRLGRNVFEAIVEDDRKAGSWLTPTNVVTNENISIVEIAHFNSPEHPNHCPVRSVMILFRNERIASKVGIHMSWQ